VRVLTTQCNALLSTEAGSSQGQSSARHAAFATASGPLGRRRASRRFSQRVGFHFITGGPTTFTNWCPPRHKFTADGEARTVGVVSTSQWKIQPDGLRTLPVFADGK